METRKQAIAAGKSKYFTGKLCVRGHLAQRYTATAHCCVCNMENTQAWQKNNNHEWVRVTSMVPRDQVWALRNFAKLLRG